MKQHGNSKERNCLSVHNVQIPRSDTTMSQTVVITEAQVSCIATPRHGQLTYQITAEAMLNPRAIAPVLGESRGHEQ